MSEYATQDEIAAFQAAEPENQVVSVKWSTPEAEGSGLLTVTLVNGEERSYWMRSPGWEQEQK
jgi:hypothetical protein